MLFATMQRKASERREAIEVVQQFPAARDVVTMRAALNVTTLVFAVAVTLANTGTAARSIAVAAATKAAVLMREPSSTKASISSPSYAGAMTDAVVLVHGLIGNMRVPSIAERLHVPRVIVPDLLGYGVYMREPPERISIDAQVGHVHRLVHGHDRVHLVGHSAGGAIVMAFAGKYSDRVASVVSVEGNFTLKDAFWSGSLAKNGDDEVQAMLDGFLADPARWLSESGIVPDDQRVEIARKWLQNQPGSTVRAMAASVVDVTGQGEYLRMVRGIMEGPVPCHLIAGERSRDGWDVPDWALTSAASVTVIPRTGHMLMIEDPDAFAAAIKRAIGCNQ